jgi:hypothetical protein
MPKKLTKEILEQGHEFAALWRTVSECMAKALHEPTFDPQWEKEFLDASMRLAELAVPVTKGLKLDRDFTEKVMSFLEEVFALRYLKELQEFQVTLLRDRWSAVNLELSRILGLEVTRLR